MVFVKVRETYDLHTVKNKMTVIGIHTPNPNIIKRNFPGLLMQCRAYRPVFADVRVACASVLPLDPSGVGLAEGDVAPEDVFNPILYKAMSNKGMSQLEARINSMTEGSVDVQGDTVDVDVDTVTSSADEFPVYYGLLSNAHDWKHANPQSGLSMSNLRPFVYELNYNVGDMIGGNPKVTANNYSAPDTTGDKVSVTMSSIIGKAKPMPFINCTSFSYDSGSKTSSGWEYSGFRVTDGKGDVANCEVDVPWIRVICGAIIIPPSRLHELFYRLVCEWTLEFSMIRPIGEITTWSDLANLGNATHYQNYSYSATKEALTGDSNSILDNDSCMVSANVGLTKVM